MPDPQQERPAGPLRRALAAVGRAIAAVLLAPVRFLARPLNRELSELRSQVRAYGEGSIETTSAIGTELRSISRSLDEELPKLRERIEALERELADRRGDDPPPPASG